jgi:peptide/nickel transport system ATP-binding protein
MNQPTTANVPETSSSPDPEALLQLRDVSVHFRIANRHRTRPEGVIRAVDGVTFSVAGGATFGLVGESGSGKSTIARVILGLVEPTSGTIIVAGHDTRELKGGARRAHGRLVQVVLQDPFSSLDPRMNVGEIIAEPITLAYPMKGRTTATRSRITELLQLVGLPASSSKLHPHQFSGGQRQRVAIARALASRPVLIVLDEPTSALDVSIRAQILNLLKDIQTNLGVTYLVISHDLATIAYMASEVAVMYLGRIVERGPIQDLYRRPNHPYTWLLLASALGGNRVRDTELAVAGEIPTAMRLPSGCRFHPRCTLRTKLKVGDANRCTTDEPDLRELSPGRWSACHFPQEMVQLDGPV